MSLHFCWKQIHTVLFVFLYLHCQRYIRTYVLHNFCRFIKIFLFQAELQGLKYIIMYLHQVSFVFKLSSSLLDKFIVRICRVTNHTLLLYLFFDPFYSFWSCNLSTHVCFLSDISISRSQLFFNSFSLIITRQFKFNFLPYDEETDRAEECAGADTQPGPARARRPQSDCQSQERLSGTGCHR